jgi:hypothetical protein
VPVDDKMFAALQAMARQVDKELFRDPRPGGGFLLFDRPAFNIKPDFLKPLHSFPKWKEDLGFEARVGAYQQFTLHPYHSDFSVTRLELYGWDRIKADARSRRFEDEHDVW